MTTRRLILLLAALALLDFGAGAAWGIHLERRRVAAEEAEALTPRVVGAAHP